ncbi:DUF4169 family protein [uncultured Sphingomonas sp.]|uniref:DUF4169 family protein n=1 Tax=uncultured Sphingomonas sp. TaxID=158754 RepID=UPI0025F74330|nr:DUF4169 family protein [uncultured Sphingomonas sp.]
MGEVVNLRRARKAKARAEAETTAATNRAAFGRTKAEKQRDAVARDRLNATLDGARRERD